MTFSGYRCKSNLSDDDVPHCKKVVLSKKKSVKVNQAVAKKRYMKGVKRGNKRELGGQWACAL